VESLQQGGELHVRCQASQNAEMQTASDDTLLRPDRLNPIIQQHETTARMFKEKFSSRSQGDFASRARNELASEFLFELFDGHGQPRLNDVHALSGSRKLALFRQSDEVLQVSHLHM
jgi:hypothetical protein